MHNYPHAALFEHRFWLQILGDHGRFLQSSLAPSEGAEIGRATAFIDAFDTLLERARGDLNPGELMVLNQQAHSAARQLREFKLHLLRRHLTGEVKIALPPTFLNHMVNELDEYLRILAALEEGKMPPRFHPIHHHLLWLPDASGHASAIEDRLDAIEQELKKKSKKFAKRFDLYFIKATEGAGFLRTNLSDFPALHRFNKEVVGTVHLFMAFLRELEAMDLSNTVLDILDPLMPDHMFREECYYLTKLAQVSDIDHPDCDPTKPRLKD